MLRGEAENKSIRKTVCILCYVCTFFLTVRSQTTVACFNLPSPSELMMLGPGDTTHCLWRLRGRSTPEAREGRRCRQDSQGGRSIFYELTKVVRGNFIQAVCHYYPGHNQCSTVGPTRLRFCLSVGALVVGLGRGNRAVFTTHGYNVRVRTPIASSISKPALPLLFLFVQATGDGSGSTRRR